MNYQNFKFYFFILFILCSFALAQDKAAEEEPKAPKDAEAPEKKDIPKTAAQFRPESAPQRLPAEEEKEPLDPNCIFGNRNDLTFCQWRNMNTSREMWKLSKGDNAGWLGGPSRDQTTDDEDGGYLLYETSKLGGNQGANTILPFFTALLMSPLLPMTESSGNCINFWYSMKGLSQERLRILLRRPSPALALLPGGTDNVTDEFLLESFLQSDGRDDIVLWEHHDSTEGDWDNGQAVYAFNNRHILIFEGIPLLPADPNRAYRGYIALDTIALQDGNECAPSCTFERGFCSWGPDSDPDFFSWSQARGSDDPSTGPPMDRFSFSYGTDGGGYAFIDSDYPRKPGDKARLVSTVFSPPEPDMPLCMRFWTHMFGNGIGALRVITRTESTGDEEVIWELEHEQENNWYQAQVTITAENNFEIIFEGEVGQNNLGDIAIDEITLQENSCPTSPQTSSRLKGDCTFEVDECEWSNVQDFGNRDRLVNWQKGLASQIRAPSIDHTTKTPSGHYMALAKSSIQRLERAWLRSPLIKGEGKPMCMSFWYFMYDHPIRQAGPSLGSLKVLTVQEPRGDLRATNAVPLWELKNHQGPNWKQGQVMFQSQGDFHLIFEGSWGNVQGNGLMAIDDITFYMGECSVKPAKAKANLIDCDFSRDFCSFMNSSNTRILWVPATISRRPNLNDHTYGGPAGYGYFEVFRTVNNEVPEVSLMSGVMERSEDREPACLTFWFAAIGISAKLKVTREVADASNNDPDSQTGAPQVLWQVSNDITGDRIQWIYGQVTISTNTDYKLSFVGEATRGGFALDDVRLLPGSCKVKPKGADVSGLDNE